MKAARRVVFLFAYMDYKIYNLLWKRSTILNQKKVYWYLTIIWFKKRHCRFYNGIEEVV